MDALTKKLADALRRLSSGMGNPAVMSNISIEMGLVELALERIGQRDELRRQLKEKTQECERWDRADQCLAKRGIKVMHCTSMPNGPGDVVISGLKFDQIDDLRKQVERAVQIVTKMRAAWIFEATQGDGIMEKHEPVLFGADAFLAAESQRTADEVKS